MIQVKSNSLKMLKLAVLILAVICLTNANRFGHNKLLPGRIVGGVKINIEDAPYQLALLFAGHLRCGGLYQL